MSELSALLGLYASVDQLVLEDRDRFPALAAVIPVYRWGGEVSAALGPDQPPVEPTLGWSALVTELGMPGLTLDLHEALAAFEALQEPTPLERAKRLRAAWMVLQVLPTPDTKAACTWLLRPLVRDARAMGGGDVGEAVVVEEAADLIELLASDAFSVAEDWPRLLQECADRRYVSMAVVSLASVSCIDRPAWTRRPDGDIDPVASIKTAIEGFDLGTVTMEDARTRLQPSAWPDCFGHFWCDMIQLTAPRGARSTFTWCREVVGDCPTEWFRPVLRFATTPETAGDVLVGFRINYQLATPDDMAALSAARSTVGAQDSRLMDDSGTIVVERPELRADTTLVNITTTKKIGFEGYPTGGVALLACVTGWADQTRLMMDGCLHP